MSGSWHVDTEPGSAIPLVHFYWEVRVVRDDSKDSESAKTNDQKKEPLTAEEVKAVLRDAGSTADELQERIKRVFELSPENASLRLK